ncbi:GDSL esterase/lipase At2g27360-like [Curcuma longa]|uniref:GDSL esterase/lipase At2g27360-like n=1 Tax=Curcuma longa TaxID=136217 RepID=UPI003D9DCD69
MVPSLYTTFPCLVLFLLLFIVAPATGGYSALLAFGNSLTDTGNLAYFGGDVIPANHLPYGETYFRHPTGRFSDGRLVVDFIAQALGLPLVAPYLAGNNSKEHLKRGANFAVAGACALAFFEAQGTNISCADYSFNVQLSWFHQYQRSFPSEKLIQQPDLYEFVTPEAKPFFFIGEMGINDYIHLLLLDRVNSTDIQRYAPLVVHAIGATTDSLIQGGAETILVSGIFPLGCSPLYLTVYQEDRRNPKTGCIEWLNDFIEYHNRLLQRELERLRRRYPQSEILYADYYGPIMNLYLHPGTFGIDETLVACCGGEGPYNFSVSIPCGSPLSILCSDPSRYVSWDGLHLTEAAHAIVASHILKSFDAKSTPGTISSRQANEANNDVQ